MSRILKANVFTAFDLKASLWHVQNNYTSLTLRHKTADKQWYFMLPAPVNVEEPACLPTLRQLLLETEFLWLLKRCKMTQPKLISSAWKKNKHKQINKLIFTN